MLPCEKGAAKKGLMSPPLPPFATKGGQLKPALKVERGKGISRDFSRVSLVTLLGGSREVCPFTRIRTEEGTAALLLLVRHFAEQQAAVCV